MKTPTKQAYQDALDVVKRYEDRQKVLKGIDNDLSYKLQGFDQIKFKVDKKAKEVLFTGLHRETAKVVLGKSVCGDKDEFELNIGKLIAVKKALHEDITDVVKHVEEKDFFTVSGGFLAKYKGTPVTLTSDIDWEPTWVTSSTLASK